MKPAPTKLRLWTILFSMIPIVGIVWVWLSPLSFVPVPWPDDSAFYFPAKDLFSWPPRWVMIPQAPFEPSYREWNFNTMPLFPILIGLARIVGIDGSHALKLLPLLGWLFSCLYVVCALTKESRSKLLILAAAMLLTFNPILRWSSVLVRPESIIGFCGIFTLFGYRFGWPEYLRERRWFHPVSLALAVGAYLHFNAIHLVPVVIALYWAEPKKIVKIGYLTALALTPWLITILLKPALFIQQMDLQFKRLSGYQNPWLNSWGEFLKALLSDMGSPDAWSPLVQSAVLASVLLIPVLLLATGWILFRRAAHQRKAAATPSGRTLLAAVTWVLSSAYLWHTKAEVWFTHFMHLSFAAWLILTLHEVQQTLAPRTRLKPIRVLIPFIAIAISGVFFLEQLAQASRLSSGQTWKWSTYRDFVDCIEGYLAKEDARLGHVRPFKVWAPTFPDILIELSRKHPDWEFTRTNDFYQRWHLGVQHGHEANAVVVPETYRPDEQWSNGPLSERPGARSVWMNWEQYFLNQLERDPAFKPRRYLCQRGRWDGFIYLPSADLAKTR